MGGALLAGIELGQQGLGISGGVCAVFGVYLLWLWQLKKNNNSPQINRAWGSAMMMVGFNVFLGLTVANISNLGHLGGIIVGLALAKFYLKPKVRYVY